MRITTDACFFGAYLAAHANKRGACLDIGTGTGLLSLMLAQQGVGPITALELNPEACAVAKLNFSASPWSQFFTLELADVRHWNQIEKYQSYPLIISNPPFFQSNTRSTYAPKRMAMHQETLSFKELLQVAARYLHPGGQFWLLLPFEEAVQVEYMALEHGLYLKQRLDLAEHPSKPWLRCILTFEARVGGFKKRDSCFIKSDDGSYSPYFITYMKDYYLEL